MRHRSILAVCAAAALALTVPTAASAQRGFHHGFHGGFHHGGFHGGFHRGGFHRGFHRGGFGFGGFGAGLALGTLAAAASPWGGFGYYGYRDPYYSYAAYPYYDYGYARSPVFSYAAYPYGYRSGCYFTRRPAWGPFGWRSRRVEVCY